MFTEGKQHLAYHTLQHHVAPHCRSDLLYKAALQDRSRTVWRGMIKVDHGGPADRRLPAQRQPVAERRTRGPIRSRAWRSKPTMCAARTVSTTGRVDEELIFYAMTRGFTRREAVRMIVSGFFQQVFDRITIESVRDARRRSARVRIRVGGRAQSVSAVTRHRLDFITARLAREPGAERGPPRSSGDKSPH